MTDKDPIECATREENVIDMMTFAGAYLEKTKDLPSWALATQKRIRAAVHLNQVCRPGMLGSLFKLNQSLNRDEYLS